MKKLSDSELLKRVNSWVWEAQWAQRDWRADSWRSEETYDGGEATLSESDRVKMQNAGIDPIYVNRIFPACNMLLGSQAINRFDIVAKGRTKKDGEISQVMTEGIKFVMDQYDGEFIVSSAFKDQIVPGFGCVSPYLNNEDPRKEKVALRHKDWKTIWWDPFSDPWWSPEKTRYVFSQQWMDLEDLVGMFPDKEKEIDAAYSDLAGSSREMGSANLIDEASLVEEQIRTLSSSDWIDEGRKRVRPVELWFPALKNCVFALYNDGRYFEINEQMDPRDAFQIISGAQQLVEANVKKMRNIFFFGENLILQHMASPYPHDQYPYVPFVGYLDRFKSPYGMPRQIRGQNEEVTKRRSMALAMLIKRRVVAEKGVVEDGDLDQLQELYKEANKLDGFIAVEDGKIDKFKIQDLVNLAAPQVDLMRQSELEIREIAGPNAAMMGYEQSGQSGVAKQTDIARGQLATATLFDNLRRSMKMLGDQTACNIQGAWKYEKVLRVTDRLTGAERFVTLNQPVGGYEVKNNITQGKFDIVISEAEAADTVREKNLDLLYAAIEKSPPEAVPTLLMAAFEMSNLPNKELLIEKLKPVFGMSPEEEEMTPEQAKEMALQTIEQQKQKQQMVEQVEIAAMKAKLEQEQLKNKELEAKIRKIEMDTGTALVKASIDVEKNEMQKESEAVSMIEKGFDIADRLNGDTEDDTAGRSQV